MKKDKIIVLMVASFAIGTLSVHAQRPPEAEKSDTQLLLPLDSGAAEPLEVYLVTGENVPLVDDIATIVPPQSPIVSRLAACVGYVKKSCVGRACKNIADAFKRCEKRYPVASFNIKRIGALLGAASLYWSIRYLEPGSGTAVAARIAAGTALGEVTKFTFSDIGRLKRFLIGLSMVGVSMGVDYLIMPQFDIVLALAPLGIAAGMPMLKTGYRPLLKALRKSLEKARLAKEGVKGGGEEEYDAEEGIKKLTQELAAVRDEVASLKTERVAGAAVSSIVVEKVKDLISEYGSSF